MSHIVDLKQLNETDPGMSLERVSMRVEGPARRLDEGLGLQVGSVQAFRVNTGQYEFPVAINTRVTDGHLLVSFHGIRGDTDDGYAAFRHLTWSAPLQTAILGISDPDCEQLWPGVKMRATCYLGRFDAPPDAQINALIDRVAEELGIAPHRVVLYGLSIGAAAAMRLAASRPVGRAIISNPLTDVDGLRRYVETWLYREGISHHQLEAARAAQPWRFEAVAAWKKGLADGHDLRLLVVQGLNDHLTTRRQFPYLCQALGLSAERGGPSADGRALLILHAADGHTSEPTLAVHQLARAAFDLPAEQLASASLPGLRPGSWRLEDSQVEQVGMGGHSRKVVGAGPGVAHTQASLRPLAEPANSGILLLAGSPGTAPGAWADVLADVPGWQRVPDEAVREGIAQDGCLRPSHLGVNGEPTQPSEGQWLLVSAPKAFDGRPAVLDAMPESRALYLLCNPIDAIAAALKEPARPSLAQCVAGWNRSVQGALAACQGESGARLGVVAIEQLDEPAVLDALLHWLGRAARADLQPRLNRWLSKRRSLASTVWLEGLSAPERRQLLLSLDWATYQQLSATRD